MKPFRCSIDDARVRDIRELVSPLYVRREFPLSERASESALDARRAIHDVLHGTDDRLVVIVGPCSIHDYNAALDYATRLNSRKRELAEQLIIIMRVYFEKPRTTVGWKGLINDPRLDDSFQINEGLRLARRMLLEISELGLSAGTEYLDMVTPQYISDLIAWGAIGARTTESQIHRQLASGLSCPVGFKNGTDGGIKVAADAVTAASVPHHFLGATKGGHAAIVHTTGNDDCHIILRGGKTPNYDSVGVDAACVELGRAGLAQRVMIDFSHANCGKQYERQMDVARDVAGQISSGDTRIIGAMIESHINPGRQELAAGKTLAYGVSITDPCIGWDATSEVLYCLSEAVVRRRVAITDSARRATLRAR
jgi:3-deoxy-7-phosphoheptulonate synthase